MENDAEKIDRLFRERLTNYEQKPEDKVWERIAGRMGTSGHRKISYLFIRIAAGMTLLLSLGLGYFLINRQDEQAPPSITSYSSRDKVTKDSIPKERARKSNSNQTERKKAKKSNRNQPVRRVYKGPELVIMEDQGKNETGNLNDRYVTMPGNLQGQYGRESDKIAAVQGRKMTLLTVPLTASLENPGKISGSATAPDSGYLLSLQENFPSGEPEPPRQSKWILGGEIAPLYSYRTLASDNINRSLTNTTNKSESGLFAYAGGIRIGYSAGRRLSVQSGLYYSRYGQEKGNVEAYTTHSDVVNSTMAEVNFISIPNSTGTIDAGRNENKKEDEVIINSADSRSNLNYFSGFPAVNSNSLIPVAGNDMSATQFFDYLELPVTVKYKIIDRKFGFSLIGGVVTNFLVNNGINLTNNGSTHEIAKTSDINKVNYLGSVGLGFEYPLVKNVAFSLEPRFRYYINPIDRPSQINVRPYVHPYSFGIFAGISYGF